MTEMNGTTTWTPVYASHDPGAVNAVRSFLEDANIAAKVEGKETFWLHAASGYGLWRSPYPQPRVVVDNELLVEAKAVIDDFEQRVIDHDRRLVAKWDLRTPEQLRRGEAVDELRRILLLKDEEANEVDPKLGPSIPDVVPMLENLFRFPKYFRTRRLILRGVPLWDLTASDVARAGLMKPWNFNLYESAFAAAPAALIAFLAHFGGSTALDKDGGALSGQVLTQATSLATPIALGVAAFASAHFSCPSETDDRATNLRARYAYWYLDGAFGLVSQATISLLIALSALILVTDNVQIIIAVPMLIATFRQWQVTALIIPDRLFKLNGYRSALERPAPRIGFRRVPSYSRYTNGTYLALLVAAGLFTLLVWAILLVAVGFEASVHM
jgi:hypothetical protein